MPDDLTCSREEQILQTLVQALIEINRRDLASFFVDADLVFEEGENYNNYGLYYEAVIVYLPYASYITVEEDSDVKAEIKRILQSIVKDNINYFKTKDGIRFAVKLLDIDPEWRRQIKYLIANQKELNQGLVTEKAFARRKQKPLIYNEMKFASQAEIRIAQELEVRRVLFFPLPLAVRRETGDFYKDHREVDFLVCSNGTWGILEISKHPNRYEKDAEKDVWFKKSGILCVEHRSTERCQAEPKAVVDEFIKILDQHKR